MGDMTTIQIALPAEFVERLERIEAKLDQLAPEERLWTTKDVAEFLNVTEETVRTWARQGKIHQVLPRVGKHMRFNADEIRRMKR